MSIDNTIRKHLEAAEADGRTLTDAEASLIENVTAATFERHEPTPIVEPTRTADVGDGMTPNRDQLERLVTAIETREPVTITAAAVSYDTHLTSGQRMVDAARVAQFLSDLGAVRVGSARKIDVPTIASGDAAAWTTGSKSEIVTELSSVASGVYAAFTEVTSLGVMDIPSLEGLLSTLLGRRVIAAENTGLAEQLATQATAGAGGTSGAEAIADAMVAAAAGGTNANALLLSSACATSALSEIKSGDSADSKLWSSRMFGLPYLIVPGMTSADAIAVDARALTVSASPVMVLVDPYSASKTNGVIVRVETSAAVVVNDANATGASSITAAGRSTK